MKVHEYNEMMAYMLRPRQKFAIGGGVIEGEDLGSRKGFDEPELNPTRRQKNPVRTDISAEKQKVADDVLEQLTEEYGLEICGISKEKDEYIISLTGWNDDDIEKSNRGVVRSIKKLYESKDAVGVKGLVTMDELPQWTDIDGPPSPKKLVSKLKEQGFKRLYL